MTRAHELSGGAEIARVKFIKEVIEGRHGEGNKDKTPVIGESENLIPPKEGPRSKEQLK